MFQKNQNVYLTTGDDSRVRKVQAATSADTDRSPIVQFSPNPSATPVQLVTSGDTSRYPSLSLFSGTAGAPAAWFRQGIGVTVTGSGVSSWADQSGNGRDLLQGTDANRPLYLPFAGTKYGWLPGVASNYFSTPDSAALGVTDLDISFRIYMADWTPSGLMSPFNRAQVSATQRSWFTQINSDGTILLNTSPDGTAASGVTGTSTSATGITDGTAAWIRITLDVNDGSGNRVYNFYKAADSDSEPTSWTKIGNTVTTAGVTTIFDGTSQIEVGTLFNGSASQIFSGRVYRAIQKSSIGGPSIIDFNPSDATDLASSWVSSTTGETWTVNTSGSKPAQVVGRSSILFDGTAHYLKTSPFTLNQPETVYLLFRQVSWTLNDYIFDGNTIASMTLSQQGSSPNIRADAGASSSNNANLAVGAYGVVCEVLNGASSVLQVNLTSPTTGNFGASNGGGFTLGAGPTPTNYSNIQVLESIIFPTAHDATTRARVIQYLAGIGGVSL